MKIALIGTRGVPANYGGFETCVEEVGSRLASMGHEVTVYCRSSSYAKRLVSYKGMKLVYLPSLKRKSLETLSHTFLSILHAVIRPFDILMVFNVANSPFLIFPRIFRKKTAINTDGLEWKRGKWGLVGKTYFKLSEWIGAKLTDRIVADCAVLQDYYLKNYQVSSSLIAYGAYPAHSKKPELLNLLGVNPNDYFLQITRFEPENNPLLTIEAFKKLKTNKKLVLVGGVKYPGPYSNKVLETADERIILPGFIYDKELLDELWCNSYSYIHGNEVGGTNPALLQSMASGTFIIAIDIPFSRDVLKDCGIFYQKDSSHLAEQMKWSLENPKLLEGYKVKAVERTREFYSWNQVAKEYESLFKGLLKEDFT